MVTLSQNQTDEKTVNLPSHKAAPSLAGKHSGDAKVHMTSKLKTELPQLIVWIVAIPFLAVWPFLSAFPVLSLIGSSGLILATWLNVGFALTGFWSLGCGFWIMRWLTDGRLPAGKGTDKRLLIGGYAISWTGLYVAAAMWPTL
jgi:hypothetical protein